ncbi:MAG: hypothetical protein ACJAVV_001191 [Alphaproteobacteria bacterium]|jgi:hypothetical protein
MLSILFRKAFSSTSKLIAISIMGFLFVGSVTANAATSASMKTLSLQNLERERAALIQDILSPALDIQQRQQQLIKRQRHLTDMERMVMRDERLLVSTSPLVKNAFKQYDLTFLVHAGAENKRSASEHWLSTMNVTSDAVLNTQVGYRK